MKKPYDQSQVSKNKSNFTLPTSNKANYLSPLKQHGYGFMWTVFHCNVCSPECISLVILAEGGCVCLMKTSVMNGAKKTCRLQNWSSEATSESLRELRELTVPSNAFFCSALCGLLHFKRCCTYSKH